MKNPGLPPTNNNIRGGNLELPKLDDNNNIAKWTDGIDLETKQPKPFDLDLKDFYTEAELESILNGKTKEEAERISLNNDKALLLNNEKIVQFNDRVLEISELSEADLELLYHDKNTSDSDKSIISCIKILSLEPKAAYDDNKKLYENVCKATESLYGFNIILARKTLKIHGSHFRILTEKEREKILSDSVENIASAALESFAMNPNYRISRIMDYDDYLYGILLDCTKEEVRKENGINTIKEKIDLEEFQERVIESMSGILINEESRNKEYSKEEFERLTEQSADMYADYFTGRHFPTRASIDDEVQAARQNSLANIHAPRDKDEEEKVFFDRFNEKIRNSNDEVFKYDKKVAKADMKQWANKIDLNEIDRINNDNNANFIYKLTSIAAYIQQALGVKNLDKDGRSRLIKIKWLRPEEPKLKKAIRRLLNISMENEELPESHNPAFYKHSERSIYLLPPKPSQKIPNRATRTKIPDQMIKTIVHEMWHAKQHELIDDERAKLIFSEYSAINTNYKTRMRWMNSLAYIGSTRTIGYRMQMMEREAYALEEWVQEALDERRKKRRGRKSLSSVFEK